MPDPSSVTPYSWLMTANAAYNWTMTALNKVDERIAQMNPIVDLEEMAYAKKARDILRKSLREIKSIDNIKP